MTETLTFMFSDIEDSSKLWDLRPEPMRRALARHNTLLKAGVGAHGGAIVKDRGDGFLVVFGSAADAVAAWQARAHLSRRRDTALPVAIDIDRSGNRPRGCEVE